MSLEEEPLGEHHPWVRLSRDLLYVAKLRDIQVKALGKITECEDCGRKLLFVGRTGIGKTHFFRMLGCILGGVVVIIVPLLSLSADQVEKMNTASQDYGSIEAHHLDELGEEVINKKIIPRIEEIGKDTKSTMFLLVSPQFLIANPPVVKALLGAHKRRVLRGIGIDEVHLYVAHSAFRPAIRKLRGVLWQPLLSVNESQQPSCFFTTATMIGPYIEYLEKLTTIDLQSEVHHLWEGPEHFSQRNINVRTGVGSDNINPRINQMKAVLDASDDGKVVFFCTSIDDRNKVQAKVEKYLDQRGISVDVININGCQIKEEKFGNSGEQTVSGLNPRVGVFTAAANTGGLF